MPSTGWLPKHISLAWTSYKQGNEKHMLESKVRSEGLWVSDSRPKTFPLFFSCGPMVSNVILTAFISHGGRDYFGLVVSGFFSLPNGSYREEEENRQGSLCHFFSQLWENNNRVFCDALAAPRCLQDRGADALANR